MPETSDFYEEDEPARKDQTAIWERGVKGRTAPPAPQVGPIVFSSYDRKYSFTRNRLSATAKTPSTR